MSGGSLLSLIGILTLLHKRHITHKGGIVDASITEGTSYIASFIHNMIKANKWNHHRGTNLLDSGAPFY
jgi:alpha-methylacyl-CoA racemase